MDMQRGLLLCASLLLVAGVGFADEAPVAATVARAATEAAPTEAAPASASAPAGTQPGGAKSLLGISILGNQEAPKALVIVPWKSSQLGDTLGISQSLDDSRQPVDRDVFMRELAYYEIRSEAP
jgi:hypothetical protein